MTLCVATLMAAISCLQDGEVTARLRLLHDIMHGSFDVMNQLPEG